MCALEQCPECWRWRLVACEAHGWKLSDLPDDRLCQCDTLNE
jgi:hypothetical protein